jgi:hypothetical protein
MKTIRTVDGEHGITNCEQCWIHVMGENTNIVHGIHAKCWDYFGEMDN